MAGEIFIARQDTLEEVKQTVNEIDTNVDTVNNTTSETKTQTTGIKADTDGLKLSTDSIKQIADTILERIGLTTDVGGANTGTVNGKLNALLSAGGGISSCIRHIQWDTLHDVGVSGETATLSGFSNVQKMIVLLDGDIRLSDLTTTKLKVHRTSTSSSVDGSYQVIEFY